MKKKRIECMALAFALCLVLSLACAGCKRGNPAESSASGDLSATAGEGTADSAAPSAAPGKTEKAEKAEKVDKNEKDENAEDAESPSDGTLTDAEFSDFIADGGGRLDVSLQPKTTTRPGQTTTTTTTKKANTPGTPTTTTTTTPNDAVWDKDGDGFYDIEVH